MPWEDVFELDRPGADGRRHDRPGAPGDARGRRRGSSSRCSGRTPRPTSTATSACSSSSPSETADRAGVPAARRPARRHRAPVRVAAARARLPPGGGEHRAHARGARRRTRASTCPASTSELSTPRLLVMEEVAGRPDASRRRRATPAREAARQLLESYYRQILTVGFFHADPHPGNLKWWNDKIYFLDFGMVGEVDADDARAPAAPPHGVLARGRRVPRRRAAHRWPARTSAPTSTSGGFAGRARRARRDRFRDVVAAGDPARADPPGHHRDRRAPRRFACPRRSRSPARRSRRCSSRPPSSTRRSTRSRSPATTSSGTLGGRLRDGADPPARSLYEGQKLKCAPDPARRGDRASRRRAAGAAPPGAVLRHRAARGHDPHGRAPGRARDRGRDVHRRMGVTANETRVGAWVPITLGTIGARPHRRPAHRPFPAAQLRRRLR